MADQKKILLRRMRVYVLRSRGQPVAAIAMTEGVSVDTIKDDLAWIREFALPDPKELGELATARAEEMYREAWVNYSAQKDKEGRPAPALRSQALDRVFRAAHHLNEVLGISRDGSSIFDDQRRSG